MAINERDVPRPSNLGWSIYGCLGWGDELFHPDDLHLKQTMLACGAVCEALESDGFYTTLRFGALRVRLFSRLLALTPIAPPAFDFGDYVRVKPHRTVREGVVNAIGWHGQRQEPMFFLATSGKRTRNRYFADELDKIDPG